MYVILAFLCAALFMAVIYLARVCTKLLNKQDELVETTNKLETGLLKVCGDLATTIEEQGKDKKELVELDRDLGKAEHKLAGLMQALGIRIELRQQASEDVLPPKGTLLN